MLSIPLCFLGIVNFFSSIQAQSQYRGKAERPSGVLHSERYYGLYQVLRRSNLRLRQSVICWEHLKPRTFLWKWAKQWKWVEHWMGQKRPSNEANTESRPNKKGRVYEYVNNAKQKHFFLEGKIKAMLKNVQIRPKNMLSWAHWQL